MGVLQRSGRTEPAKESDDSPLLLFVLTQLLASQAVPIPVSGHDLLKAADLMWAHAMRFGWCISLAHKKFHLALEMPLSSALWQPLTALPT